MPSPERTRTLAGKLPLIRDWIEDTVAAYTSQAIPMFDLDLPHLGRYFPSELLREAKTVHLSELLPLPPLNEIGLEGFSRAEDLATYEATTYGNTIFLLENHQSEVLYFHELVHVLQWKRLGKEHFLFAYISGLLEFGYLHNPMEKMAFSLQEEFRRGELPADVTERIHHLTDAIWQQTVQAYSFA
jgi:hypothetical protein